MRYYSRWFLEFTQSNDYSQKFMPSLQKVSGPNAFGIYTGRIGINTLSYGINTKRLGRTTRGSGITTVRFGSTTLSLGITTKTKKILSVVNEL